jgi:hypothetical protein
MKPKKVILCVAADADVLSERAFVMATWGYSVLQAVGDEAIDALRQAHALDLVVVFTPLLSRNVGNLLDQDLDAEAVLACAQQLYPEAPTLEIRDAAWSCEQPSFATQVMALSGRQWPWADVRERLRVLTTKRRGPKPLRGAETRSACEEHQRKAVQRVAAIANEARRA